MRKILAIHCLIVPVLIAGCSNAPSQSTIEEVITKHFEARRYIVLELRVGGISPIPQSDKQYMGTEAFDVKVPLIFLEFNKDVGGTRTFKRGQNISFTDVVIRIKKTSPKSNEWIVADISGIPLP